MGYQFNSLKSLIASKVSIASLVVTPLVVSGLALVGLQTYSLVTGKSFKQINFEIGKLWEQVAADKAVLPILNYKTIEKAKSLYFPNLASEPLATRVYTNVVSPDIASKNSIISEANNFINAGEEVQKLSSLTQISEVKIPAFIQNPLLTKYYSRLSSENLINPAISPNQGKWYIGFGFSPTLNYRNFSYDPYNVSGVAVSGNYRYTFGLTEKERNASDRAITSFNVGFDFGRHISSKTRIYSGFHYASYGEQVLVKEADKSNLNFFNADFMGQSPLYEVFGTEQSSQNIPYTNTYAFLEVPLGVSVDFVQFAKSKVSVDFGVTFQKLKAVNALVYDFETDYYYWISNPNEIFCEYGIGGSVGVTASQFVADRLELFLNPQFKMNGLSTFQEPYPVSQHQYSAGLRVGFKQHLF